MSNIEWTEKTWNPVVGCEIESAGCTNCYAMKMASRIEAMQPASHYKGTTKKVNGKSVWTGKIVAAPEHIWAQPLKRKKPTTYFVNSMGDLFHPNVSDSDINSVFAIMALSPQHTFQILTKHPERMRDHLKRYETDEWADLYAVDMLWNAFKDLGLPEKRREELEWLLDQEENFDTGLCFKPDLWPHVWLGVSVENQKHADQRIPFLLDTPAAVRFISAEPLLGAVSLTSVATSKHLETLQGYEPDGEEYCFNALSADDFYSLLDNGRAVDNVEGERRPKLDWVICGGESGPNSRPMHLEWARSLRDQCVAADVPFFFKQWGSWLPWSQFNEAGIEDDPEQTRFSTREYNFESWIDVGRPLWCSDVDDEHCVAGVGKKAAGRLLDGVSHQHFPKIGEPA